MHSKNPKSAENCPPRWVETIVEIMERREAPDPMNHEAWAARFQQPQWVTLIEEKYFGAWAAWRGGELTPRKLGLTLGRQIGGQLKFWELTKERPEFVADAYADSVRQQNPDAIFKDSMLKEEWAELLEMSQEAGGDEIRDLAAQVFRIVFRQSYKDITEFFGGFSRSLTAISKQALEESVDFERATIAKVLYEHWPSVEKLESYREVADYVLRFMPKERRDFVDSDSEIRKAFDDNLRKFCRGVELKKRDRGRPRKKQDSA